MASGWGPCPGVIKPGGLLIHLGYIGWFCGPSMELGAGNTDVREM